MDLHKLYGLIQFGEPVVLDFADEREYNNFRRSILRKWKTEETVRSVCGDEEYYISCRIQSRSDSGEVSGVFQRLHRSEGVRKPKQYRIRSLDLESPSDD